MNENILQILLLCVPAICGAVVAFTKSSKVDQTSEKVERWLRRRKEILSVKNGFFSKWVIRPPVRVIVKMCDWTDSLANVGVKNGIRLAAALYIIGMWVLLLINVFVLVMILVAVILGVLLVGWIIGQATSGKDEAGNSEGREQRFDPRKIMSGAVRQDKKIYEGTNWLNEELKGRVDKEGNIYRGTNWLNEEKIGRIDGEGNMYRGTTWLNEELVGRTDEEGNILKGTNWLNEEKVGRVDEDGKVYKGTNWLNEEQTGRVGE